MDATQLTAFLSQFLPVLLQFDQEQDRQAYPEPGSKDWATAKTVWEKLQSALNDQESLQLAASQLALKPDSSARRAFFEEELSDLFEQKPDLLAAIKQCFQADAQSGTSAVRITQNVKGNQNQVTGQITGGQVIGHMSSTVSSSKDGLGMPTVKVSSPEQVSAPAIETILMLTANPVGTQPLRLGEEARALQAGLERSRHRDSYRVEQRWAVRVQDLQRALLDCEPQIVHFSGHGIGQAVDDAPSDGAYRDIGVVEDSLVGESFVVDGAQPEGLVLEDEMGRAHLVSGESLTGLFGLFADRIECVVLNTCYSANQADAIAQKIPYVVGMKRAIGDRAAREFTTGFYDALLAGQSIEFAFRLGCNTIQMQRIPEHLTPILKKP